MATTAECSIEGCTRSVLARTWCGAHYRRWIRNGDPMGGRHIRIGCAVEDCPKPHCGRGYCATHYQRLVRYGDPLYLPARDVDPVSVDRAVAGRPPLRLTTAEREETIRQLHARGLSDRVIGRHVGMGHTGVLAARKRLGLPANRPGTPYTTGRSPLVSTARPSQYAVASGGGHV